MQDARELLQKHFGYADFQPLQRSIISDVLEGRDVFVLMPTGSGKSLCYQFPAIVNKGIVVVISPLIALMKDQVDGLRANGIGASFINSTLSRAETEEAKSRLAGGFDRMLYIAPERLSSPDFIDFLKTLDIGLFAIDEAHCISEWGHDFRPDYRNVRMLREVFPRVPIIALTATAVQDVQKDIVQQLQLHEPSIYKSSFNRHNLGYFVRPKQDAYRQIVSFIGKHPKESGIIYCHSRSTAEKLAKKLRADGFRALPYHAGLSASERADNQEKFVRDDAEIIVATIAFGMGINKSNVRYVIHYDLPKNIEGYYQETGRAGRDKLRSDCILFFSYGDIIKLKAMVEKKRSAGRKQAAYGKLDAMVRFCETQECRRKLLLRYFGEELAVECNNCDVCLEPREKFDGTEVSRTAVNAVLETGQRFGMGYIISVLLGKAAKNKPYASHLSIKSFGAGKQYTQKQWQSFMRELVNLGIIDVSGGKYPVLKLNQKSRDVLYGKSSVQLIKLADIREKEPSAGEEQKADTELFEILRTLRKELATVAHLPPYVIFHDATLKEMAIHYPQNISSLKKIHGVGDAKLAKYGQQFVEKIAEYCKARSIESNI